MKIRFCILTALLLASFATVTYAAKKDYDHGISSFDTHGKDGKTDDKKSHDDNKIVSFDFNDHIKELLKDKEEKHNIYLKMCNKDKDEHEDHQEENRYKNDEVSKVPTPAALWLFGSGLLGLVGVKRKKA